MIEAILIDFIMSKNTDPSKRESILKMDLGTAIDQCKASKVLSGKTVGLSIVIKDYRNLIHPGRIIRLEQTVTEDDANVAATLIKMVAEDIAKKQQESYGYTAKQIINKIQTDSTGFPGVMKSLISNLQEREKKTLLFDLLPQENARLRRTKQTIDPWDSWDESSISLDRQITCVKHCFSEVQERVSDETKRELVRRYIELIHTATGNEREIYENAFFSVAFVRNATLEQAEIVLDHYFSVLSIGAAAEFISNVHDAYALLPNDDKSERWLHKLYAAYFAPRSMRDEEFERWYRWNIGNLPEAVYERFRRIATFNLHRYDEDGQRAEKAKEVLEIENIPF
jgi:hypothetical protein